MDDLASEWIRIARQEAARFGAVNDPVDLCGAMIEALVRAKPRELSLARIVARRAGVDWFRAQYGKRGQRMSLNSPDPMEQGDVVDEGFESRTLTTLEVRRVLREVPLADHVMLKLSLIGYSHGEIADWFGVTRQTVRRRISKHRRSL